MKKIVIALMITTMSVTALTARAQISVNINIGNQPAWGPTGYDHVDYYYMPEINCYYDIIKAQFIYLSGNRWVYGQSLPPRYSNYNLYNTYKVVVNRDMPYRNNKNDIKMYGGYKNNHSQPVIRDSRDERYYESRYHPKHNQWERQHGTTTGPRKDNGHHYGSDKNDNGHKNRNESKGRNR